MLKRTLDLIISVVAILLLSPLLVFLAIAVRIKIGKPIFFRQTRPGLNEQLFEMLKFRTMTNKCDIEGNLLPDGDRMTKFGSFLRSSSLDELPELWNVVKGEMSLVGPRPLIVEYLPLYNQHQNRRHEVKPGITGWAQINGRNAVSWEQRFKDDVWYVENRSIWLDIKILCLTIKKVVFREGISSAGHATMPKFTGSETSNATLPVQEQTK